MTATHTWTVGQQVVVSYPTHPDRLAVVERVTPTGRPVVNKTLFGREGRIGVGGTIRPATDDDLARERRLRLWRRIQTIAGQKGPPGHLTLADLQGLLRVLAPAPASDTGTPS